jgi:hypothetical protein
MTILVIGDAGSPTVLACSGEPWKALTSAQLLEFRWTLRVGVDGAAGEQDVLPIEELRGVVVCSDSLAPSALLRFHDDDRSYAAQEAHAFFEAWLSAAPCKVVNPPSPLSLASPAWPALVWGAAADKLGIPIADELRFAPPAASAGMRARGGSSVTERSVHVVGDEVVGDRPGSVAQWALDLARSLGVAYLRATYEDGGGGPRLIQLDARPELADARVRESLVRYFSDP